MNSEKYIKRIGKVNCRLQPGYEAIRTIKKENNSVVKLHLKIVQSHEGPIYQAFTLVEPVIDVSSLIIGRIPTEIFEKLGVSVKKHWSGFEFFGLDKADVLKVITAPYHEYADTVDNKLLANQGNINTIVENKLEDKKQEEVLQHIINIRRRNAGETSTLCKKASKTRNAAIRKVVDYVSFGDIKSKFIFSRISKTMGIYIYNLYVQTGSMPLW